MCPTPTQKGQAPSDILTKIESYLIDLPPDVLGIRSVNSFEIVWVLPGSYNINYRVKINGKDFIFRLNVDQQSGLPDQIEYEFNVMKSLEGRGVAPQVYHLDNTRSWFDFGIMIEEYMVGPYLSLAPEEMPDVAELLVRLHSLPCENLRMIAWPDPLVNNFEQVQGDLAGYAARKTSDPRIVQLSTKLLAQIEANVQRCHRLFQMDSLNHTDLAIDNFIRTSDGLRLIDWEKPRHDDYSYDLCCFLAEPAQLWCTPQVSSPEGRDRLLKAYASYSGKAEDLIVEKIRVREPLVSLHWVMWAGTKLCDLKENRTASELVECHEERVERWERSASVENVEKLFDLI